MIFKTFLNYISQIFLQNVIYIIAFSSLFIGIKIYFLILDKKKYFTSKKSREFLTMGTHENKHSIPSIGGLAFLASIPILLLLFKEQIKIGIFIVLTATLSSFVGLIDDITKINKAKGLAVKEKFLLQMGISFIPALYFYINFPLETVINIPYLSINIGFLYIFWIVWVTMSTTHSVNLTDGIDGLAVSQFLIILLLFPDKNIFYNFYGILFFLLFFIFFLLNKYPAKIFMGDFGSFFLGGFLASLFISQKIEILLILSGITFVGNTLSVIIQYISIRFFKKRIFLFSPYHHTLEEKGYTENQICLIFSVVTIMGNIISYFLYLKGIT